MASEADQSISASQRQCAAACIACRDACRTAIAYCQQMRGDAADAALLRLLRDCAERCDHVAAVLLTTPDQRAEMAAVAEIAGRCTRLLIQEFADDSQLQICADACHTCATCCRDAATPSIPYDAAVAESFPASDPPAR